MSTTPSASLLRALDVIEEWEARNLAWGLLDESWTHEDLVTFLAERWDEGDPEACIDELQRHKLLFALPREWPNGYRTRMSEAVRLFSHLRQLFPGRPWQTGSRLVSDVRFLRRPRMFSVRDIKADECLARLADVGLAPPVLAEVKRLLNGRELSRFQLDATAAVVSAVQSGEDRGVVVSAGTGSGKTLAFYLPALAQMSASSEGPRAVAIYPRNELLKDQFATALAEIRNLKAAGGRQLTIGAYFGLTPYKTFRDPDKQGWVKRDGKWICPFLLCPVEDKQEPDGTCGGVLAWVRPRGMPKGVNWGHLVCQRCDGRIEHHELLLTREAIQEEPPDILFTTTEMLNQQLSDGWSRHVFGVGPSAVRPPNLVLLDEIHTHSGTSGAQVAFLLRRWRKLLGQPVTWVGLSATLANAQTFFSDLCGVPLDAVSDIRPHPDDLKPRGSEYQLLLRGDPASQSALLSTSIQSLMLLRRILDETDASPKQPYGSKVFAFLENLDLVNRLYRQLLDAEGRDPIGRPSARATVLAALRTETYAGRHSTVEDMREWDRDGQHWWLAERLGFGERSLEISRTSSQDTGVDGNADIVVATSSLEVGYDDQRVGAVLQHKAPRDIAQFLQRRGRAGRLQHQRPWTVVVLSDYGRDRLAFQSYESIIDPSMPAKSLPLGNQAVRKMQAAMCLVDWISVRLNENDRWKWSARALLARPVDGAENAKILERCQDLLREVIEGGPARQDLISFVRSSLGLNEEETWSVCWEHPRSLLLEAVPTAYRRLKSTWSTVRGHQVVPKTDVTARQPLPDFIPATLFSDLELPEVEIAPPADYDSAADTSLPVGMGLSELTPGKVTLRWAVRKVRGLWIGVPESGVVDLDDRFAPDGEVVAHVPGPHGTVPVVRPLSIRPEIPPPNVRPTSNGRLRWSFMADDEADSTRVPRPRNGPLGDLLPDVRAFLNVDLGPLRTWRYALEGTAEIVNRNGRIRTTYTFARDGQPAAVGFASTVDALVLTVVVPESVAAFGLQDDVERLRQLRADLFGARARQRLENLGLGRFAADWVTEVALSIAAAAVLRGTGLSDLARADGGVWRALAEEVVDGVLLATTHTSVDETPLKDMVLAALEDFEVVRALRETIPVLQQDPDESWLPWLRARFLQTVAAAWQSAAQQVCLDFNVDTDALVDVLDDGGPRARVVISDAVPGGGGLVEALTHRISDDPRRFDALVAAASEPSDTEEVDPSLRRALDLLASHEGVREAASKFRGGHEGRLANWQSLVSVLTDEGVPRTHANLSALSTRVFRPGSGPDSDQLLRLLLRRWDEIDAQAGFAVDHRAVCAFLAADTEVLDVLERVANPSEHADWAIRAQSVLLSLLWTRACARRPETLRASNRYVSDPPLTERTLLRDVLPERPQRVDVDGDAWRADLVTVLRTWGSARIHSGSNDTAALTKALRDLMVAPLEIDWLHAYPHLDGVVRENGRYSVSVTLQEAPQ
ncbi:protein DpdJ [Saccharothrix obliqua]|uniref:protein DpdJ n=1 Tax=Saccharothrix obliqua TaxID=2861747 RepID=UPI001C5E569A|nr:protein DpdJ [Saccharothrix obliqua]MBW4717521.1 DEAD/DEAH box helicase [Saccharothrix obliqua]